MTSGTTFTLEVNPKLPRRLYTVIEKLLEEVSFGANRQQGKLIVIDAAYVDGRLKDLAQSEDLARYVL